MIRRLAIAIVLVGCGPGAPATSPVVRPEPLPDRPTPYATSGLSPFESTPDGSLSVAVARTLESGTLTLLAPKTRTTMPTGLPAPDRLAFWSTSGPRGVFVALRTSFDAHRYVTSTVASYDVDGQKVLWRRVRPREATRLVPSSNGRRLAVVNDDGTLDLLDAASGAGIASHRAAYGARVIDTARGLVVSDGKTATLLSWEDLSARCTIELPVADWPRAGALAAAGDACVAITIQHTVGKAAGSYVALLDLAGCRVEGTVPGWLDVVAGGSLFAIVRRDAPTQVASVPAAIASSAVDHHLVRLDLATLERSVVPLPGGEFPRHTWAPAGRRALFWWTHTQPQLPLRVLDVSTGTFTTVKEGPKDSLVYGTLSDHPVAFSDDGERAYVVTPHAQLARIDLGTGAIAYGATSATNLEKYPPRRPTVLVSKATGEVLVLGARDDGAIEVHDPTSLAVVATIGP